MRRALAHSISVTASCTSALASRIPACFAALAARPRLSWSSSGGRTPRSAQRVRNWENAALWKVPALTDSLSPIPARRFRSSSAALRVNVRASVRLGSMAPISDWWAIRRVSTLVLPVPAPARMHSGVSGASTAACCRLFSPSKSPSNPVTPPRYRDQ